jgi:rhamnosyltransferase
MKVAGIVVCNPDYNRLIENINVLHPQVDRIAVYLNSEINRSRLNGLDKLQYLSDGNNRGIATALNAIMSYADKLGADWCLLLDQDSVVSKKCVEGYEKYKNLDNAAILTPFIHDDRDMEKQETAVETHTEIDMCITSGSYNNIELWKKEKGFRDEFFIDYVDWEYCARVRSRGYKVYRINEMIIDHQLGSKTYHKILWWNVFTYNHNAFRKYYITRNTIVTYRLFPDEIKLAHPYLRTWKRLLFTILFEEEKGKKTRAILRGVLDSGKLYRELKGKQEYGY